MYTARHLLQQNDKRCGEQLTSTGLSERDYVRTNIERNTAKISKAKKNNLHDQ